MFFSVWLWHLSASLAGAAGEAAAVHQHLVPDHQEDAGEGAGLPAGTVAAARQARGRPLTPVWPPVQQLRQDYSQSPSEKIQAEMQNAFKRMAHLESQLQALRASNPDAPSGHPTAAGGLPPARRPQHGPEARRSTEGPEGLRSSSFHVAPLHPPAAGGRPRSGILATSASLENLSRAMGPSPWVRASLG